MKDLIPWRRKGEGLNPSQREGNSVDVLHQRVNDLFDDFFEGFEDMFTSGTLSRREGKGRLESPSFEVSETDDEFRVKAELQGMDEKDIEVDLEGIELMIRGQKKREHEEDRRNYHVSEVSYGAFSRSMQLPAAVDRDKVKAQFKKGVLTLTLQKTEQGKAQRKKIAITSE